MTPLTSAIKNNYRFLPCFRVALVAPATVLVESENWVRELNGRPYYLVASMLNGVNSIDDITDRLSNELSAPETLFVLGDLIEKGYVSLPNVSHDPEDFYWNLYNGHGASSKSQYPDKISVTSLCGVSPREVEDCFRQYGIPVAAPSDVGDLHIVLTDDYLNPAIAEINRLAISTRKTWIIAKPEGTQVWVGPVFRPGETGCWRCLAARLSYNRLIHRAIQDSNCVAGPQSAVLSSLPSTKQIAINIIAIESLKIYQPSANEMLSHSILMFNTFTMEMTKHVVPKRAECAECGTPLSHARDLSFVVELQDERSERSSESHDSVMNRYGSLVSPITGIVPSVNQIVGLDACGVIKVFTAGINFSRNSNLSTLLHGGFRHKCAGKGTTDTQARVGALCEAIERFSGIHQGTEHHIRATYATMGSSAIPPNDYMLFSAEQFRGRSISNMSSESIHQVPDPFETDAEVDWRAAWSLTSHTYKYILSSYCYYGYPRYGTKVFAFADSNGNAAGDTIQDAVAQGFLELVERDCVSMWWYNRLSRPGVDLELCGDASVHRIVKAYASMGRSLHVLDLTNDLLVPAFAAISRRNGQREERIIFGFGCHFDANTALVRAVTEMGQSLPWADETKHGRTGSLAAERWWQDARFESETYLSPSPIEPERRPSDYELYSESATETSFQHCIRIANNHGLELLVVDQTRSDIQMPVVKVIVPGLRHFWPRFAPGRLYDVPVRLGWRLSKTREDLLNPTPMYL